MGHHHEHHSCSHHSFNTKVRISPCLLMLLCGLCSATMVVASKNDGPTAVTPIMPRPLNFAPPPQPTLLQPKLIVLDQHNGTDDHHDEHVDSAESWGYAMLTVALSSLVSLSGVLMLLCGKARIQMILPDLLGIAAGTLLGGACLSVFPEAEEALGFGLPTCVTILAGIMFGFFSEMIIHNHKASNEAIECEDVNARMSLESKANDNGTSSTPPKEISPIAATADVLPIGHSASADKVVLHAQPVTITTSASDIPVVSPNGSTEIAIQMTTPTTSVTNRNKEVPASATADQPASDVLVPHKTHAHAASHFMWINLIGDAIHNFVDGALIGATFLVNVNTGVMVGLAVALHELPQELSDFAVLLHSGLSVKRALLLNFVVSLTAFLGAIVALSVGESLEEGSAYVLPFAGGMFLYLALACIIPELMRGHGHDDHIMRNENKVKSGASLRVVCSILIGIGIMALLLLVPHEHAHAEGHAH